MVTNDGWYVYAVTKEEPLVNIDLGALRGVTDKAIGQAGRLEIVPGHGLSAVVCHFEGEKIRPERRNLASHHAVLHALMNANVSFLPVAFGMVAPSRGALDELLQASCQELIEDMERLAGKVEMCLKVFWDVPNIFEFFVSEYTEVAQLRDRLLQKPAGPSRDDQIALGQAFGLLLNKAREQHIETVKEVLESCASEFKEAQPKDEKMIMSLFCLIAREKEKAFEQAVFEIAQKFNENFAFDFSGPFPPFNFIQVSLQPPDANE